MRTMWRKVGLLCLLAALLAGCSGAGSEPAAPEPLEPAAGEAAVPATDVAAPEEAVVAAVAKPQFIEFYADW